MMPNRNEILNAAVGMAALEGLRRGYETTNAERYELAETKFLDEARNELMRTPVRPLRENENVDAAPSLVSIKPIRKSYNPTFKRHTPTLWSIEARYLGHCGLCGEPIQPPERISLFNRGHGWSHLGHALAAEVCSR
jgi:hypothetical protein